MIFVCGVHRNVSNCFHRTISYYLSMHLLHTYYQHACKSGIIPILRVIITVVITDNR